MNKDMCRLLMERFKAFHNMISFEEFIIVSDGILKFP